MQSKSIAAGGRSRSVAPQQAGAPLLTPRSGASVATTPSVLTREAPSRQPAATQPRRIQLLGIDERSPGTDLVIANIFKTMRASIGIPPADLVRLLQTRSEVLANLEAGRVRALPPLPELTRLIKDYGALLDIDAGPIISRIKEQTADRAAPMQATPATAEHRRLNQRLGTAALVSWLWRRRDAAAEDGAGKAVAAVSTPAHPMAAVADAPKKMQPAKPSRRSRRWRSLATAVVSLALLLGAAWTAQSHQPVLFAAVDQLPPGVAKGLRRGIEMIALSLSASRDGLTWIETSDPRRRKADKLPVKGRD